MLTATLPIIRRFMVDWFDNAFEPVGEVMANVTLQIPDELIARLGETPAAREKFAREAVAVAAVRLGLLYKPEARQIAGQTRAGFLHVLGQHKVPDDIDADAVVEGYQAIEKLFPK